MCQVCETSVQIQSACIGKRIESIISAINKSIKISQLEEHAGPLEGAGVHEKPVLTLNQISAASVLRNGQSDLARLLQDKRMQCGDRASRQNPVGFECLMTLLFTILPKT